VSAPRRGDVFQAMGREEALGAWLSQVHTRTGSGAAAPGSMRARLTLPRRGVRRFRGLVSELGLSQAVMVSAEYVGRRLRRDR
jgi:hypothetical protein